MAPAKSSGDRTDENVAIAHVAEFMSDHAFQFVVGEESENALGYGDGGVIRIASGVARKRSASRSG